MNVTIEPENLTAVLSFAPADLETAVLTDRDRDGNVTPPGLEAARLALERFALRTLEVQFDGWPSEANEVQVFLSDRETICFRLRFTFQFPSELTVRSSLLADLPSGHRQYVSLHESAGTLIAERLLDAKNNLFRSALNGSINSLRPWSDRFVQFLLLGVEHILTGYDHLLFLLALLVVGGSLKETVKIISAFTLAHSLTLALSVLDLVRIPIGIVEPAIAISVIYIGFENVFRRTLNRRWLLSFGFGLIHGLGFASVLHELGLGNSGAITIPLVSFNIGVELGQLAIAMAVLPLIWKLKSQPSFEVRYVPGCSVIFILAGTYWLFERVL